MASASIEQIISHFAGYLRIFDDVARDRVAYDEGLAPRPDDDYTTLRPDYEHPFAPDDLDTAGGPVPALIADDPMHVFQGRPLKLSHDPQDLDPDHFPPPLNPKVVLPSPPGGGGGGGVEHHITVKYQDAGEETQLTVHQHNFMHDNDTNLSPDALAAVAPLIAALNSDALTTIEHLVADASAEVPADWWMKQNDGGTVEFVTAHDAAWAERGGTPGEHSVPAGYYVNGELQERPTEPSPPLKFDDLPDTGQGIGQWASLGNNESINAGLIVDIGEGVRTMVVMGDYFKTNAFFQTNTTVDKDEVHVSGGDGKPSVTCGENTATNIADFQQNPSIYADFPAHSSGPSWIVDKVEGNYYSIHAVVQTNYLDDNDVAMQVSAISHYNLVGGFNELGNVTQIFDGEIKFDLIIVQGAYHGMNVIFQNNILLNNDRIFVSADRCDPSQSVDSGHNSLLNDGSIQNYGDDCRDLIPGLRTIDSLLANGVTSIDPELGSAIAGHGGLLRVLYVGGDYYDVNAIWQTNITCDINVMYQLQNQPSADLLALHPDSDLTQSVSTGNNKLTNQATIVDVNPDTTYVNGQVYSDSILVQANLLPADHHDAAVNADTHALVTELVAFVDDNQDHNNCGSSNVVSSPVQADPMASVLH